MTDLRPAAPITLYRHVLSGHCHRAQLFLSLLGLPHTLVDVDLVQGEHKQPAFLARNVFGQVPVIDDGGTLVADSNAILVYLAMTYGGGRWWPTEPRRMAEIQRWLSIAAGPLAAGPAAARLVNVFGAKLDAPALIERSHALLRVVDGVLQSSPFLAAAEPTLADIALYSYVAHAPEGGVDLADYPRVRAWLGRLEALPGFVPMARTRAGLAS